MSRFKLYGKTDIGCCRTSNQDSMLMEDLNESTRLAVLCDGMGGVSGGQVASSLAVSTIADVIREDYHPNMTTGTIRTMLMHAISSGNTAVYRRGRDEELLSGMGTTCEILLLTEKRGYIAHVGDSRIYLIREGELRQVTHDHSLVQTMVDQGQLTPEEARVHPKKNIITRVVGVDPIVDVDFIEINHIENTQFLLCSDGLSTPCPDAAIAEVLNKTPADQVCDALVAIAKEAGGPDNITVIYLAEEQEETL